MATFETNPLITIVLMYSSFYTTSTKQTFLVKRFLKVSIHFLFLLFFSLHINAQKTIGTLRLKSGEISIKENISDLGVKQEIQKGKWGTTIYAVIVFDKKPSLAQITRLKNSGVELLHYLPEYAYQVRFKTSPSILLLKDIGIKSIVQLPDYAKYGKEISVQINQPIPQESVIRISLLLLPGVKLNEALPVLNQIGFVLTNRQFVNQGLLGGTIAKKRITDLATLPFVAFINSARFEPQTLNHRERGASGLTALTSTQGATRQLTGQGVTVGVGDNADPTSHIDNITNLINRSPAFIPGSTHGTHVASILTGDGIVEERITGVAPGTFIISDYFDFIISKTPLYMSDYGMTLTNNSYFNGANNCPGNGVYNELSAYVDEQLYNNPYLQHVFAAGNDGTLTCAPFLNSFATIKSGYQTAKNVLSVGNFDIFSTSALYVGSSRGPVSDGRIKPEILASGNAVAGASINNAYTNNIGTSASAPFVAGIYALLTQSYKQLNGGNPKSGLVKAILCNTATDKGNAGPDYKHGFGLVNPQRAIAAVEQNRFYTNTVNMGGNHTQVIAVPAGTKQLKVMLYWHDKEGSPINPFALENDLDIKVTDGVVFNPLILNPAPGSVDNAAVQGVDRINNIEQVIINNPGASVLINVNGFNVTGAQEFFISYDFVQPELVLLYPYGGEHFVTRSSSGRDEMIAWEANDNSTDTYKLEYSVNDGFTWIDIVNNIPANQFRYIWSVPDGEAQKAKVRIKRTGGVTYSTSVGNFVISSLPVLTVSAPCEGYVNLSWPAVGGATDYQVMQLINGSLLTIATTSSLSYLVPGLDRNSTYWFSIRPRLTDTLARRSDAKRIIPVFSTPCTTALYDSDLKIDTLLAPANGRKNTSTTLSATQQITIRIKNLDDNVSSNNYTISYQVNAGPVVNEVPATVIAAGATTDYTFTATYNFSNVNTYNIRVFVKQTGDLRIENDEKSYIIRLVENLPVAVNFIENFEGTGNDEYRRNSFALSSLDRFDYENNNPNGRMRTFLNAGASINGNRSVFLDAAQFLGTNANNKLYATFNMNNIAALPGLRFDFKFRNQGQLRSPSTGVWMRGSDGNPWVQVYNLTANQGRLGEVKQPSIDINEVMANAGQTLTSSFQVRFDQEGMISANNAAYDAGVPDFDDGFTFDDIRIVAANNDLKATAILAPATFNCGATNTAVTIRVKNTTGTTYNNVPVFYRIDNGSAVAGIITTLTANSTFDYTFPITVNLSVYKSYDVDAWVQLAGDDYALNDSITNQVVHNSPVVSSFPYLEKFESGNGNYFSTDVYATWEWGEISAAAKPILIRAANGQKAWFTALNGAYKQNEFSYLYSPCFNLSSLTNPVFSFAHISQQQDNFDNHTIEYTTDNGITWIRMGVQGQGTNWFTDATQIWRTTYSRWHVSSIDIPTTAASVRFRFLFTSDQLTSREGIGIDNIHIFEKETVYTGADVININQNITATSNWFDFKSGGTIVASINPLGQNLGSTNVSVYINTAAVRNQNNQYYLDRNIVINPANTLTDSVAVRFYFTEQEVMALLSASGCGTCTKFRDAFIAGITKYSQIGEENGTLSDNTTGNYKFILPANVLVVPYNNGYYAEFKVRSFSEFWINGGGPNLNLPLPVTLVNFTGTKRSTHVDLKWQTETESNSNRFEIERRIDNETQYVNIGSVAAAGNSVQTIQYTYTDENVLNKGRKFYYRLKMVDEDGKFAYSNIVTISSAATEIFVEGVYNNTANTLQIISGNQFSVKQITIRILNTAGQTVLTQQLPYTDARIDVSKLSAGIYFIEIKNANGVETYLQKFVRNN